MTPEKLAELEAIASKADDLESDIRSGIGADYHGHQRQEVDDAHEALDGAYELLKALPALIARVRELEAESAELRRET